MISRPRRLPASTVALLGVALLCAAAPQAQPPGPKPGAGTRDHGPAEPQPARSAAEQGPQGPQVAGSNDPVPQNAPAATAANVPATTGRGNMAESPPDFAVQTIGRFDAPFALVFLPDGSLLVTEKAGTLRRRLPSGEVQTVAGTPKVAVGGQGGLLDVAIAPDFARSRRVYLSYAEPRPNGGSSLALWRATLETAGGAPRLTNGAVIWRAGSDGPGGQYGAKIAFSPDGRYLFLSSGERQRFTPAQDPNQLLGKIVRLTPDGRAAPGNPFYARGGAQAFIWSSGHRNPYGLAFDASGRLWEEEMGPKGGDEVNLILPGRNYGWPLVSNGDNYSGQPIPDHPSRPEFEAPKAWWNPSISPGGMIIYTGAMFPAWRGEALISGLGSQSLIEARLSGDTVRIVKQYDMGARIRDVAQAPDGSVWLLEDGGKGADGKLLRLTPKG